MEKISRNIGMGLYSILKSKKISIEEAADILGYSVRDTLRIIEGKLFLSPNEIKKMADSFGKTPDFFIFFKPRSNSLLPELEYNKEFSSKENLYKIIDLLDDYIELKEQM